MPAQLKLKIIRARQLPIMDTRSHTTDSYVEVSFILSAFPHAFSLHFNTIFLFFSILPCARLSHSTTRYTLRTARYALMLALTHACCRSGAGTASRKRPSVEKRFIPCGSTT